MNLTKRLFLLIIIFSFSLQTGCTSKGYSEKGNSPTTIVVWHYYNGKQKDAFDNLVSQFNESIGLEKGIIVTDQSKSNVNDLSSNIIESSEKKVGSERLPNIFATYADTAYVLYKKDMLLNFNTYLSDDELSEFIPSFLLEGELAQGQLNILPIAKSTELLYLNETDWNKFASETGADISKLSTWEGIAQVAEQYYNWSNGKAFFGRDAIANYIIIGSKQLGKEIFSVNNGESTINIMMM